MNLKIVTINLSIFLREFKEIEKFKNPNFLFKRV